jgi:hypothetical protein
MKFNRKKLSHKEIDYAMKMGLDDVPYNFHIEKKLNTKVTKFNENTNPSNFYYNFIFRDAYLFKEFNVLRRYYPMLKFHRAQNYKEFSEQDVHNFIHKHKQKYKLDKLFRKTAKDLHKYLPIK